MDVRRSLVRSLILGAGLFSAESSSTALAQRLPEKNVTRPPVRMAQRDAQAAADQVQRNAQSGQAGAQRVPPGGLRLAPQPPAAPFSPLTAEQQKELDAVLVEWERTSDKIARFKCDFERWDYDDDKISGGPKVVPPGRNDLLYLKARGAGQVKYKAPDHGAFKLEKYQQYVPEIGAKTLKYEENPLAREHWVCDGKAIYQFRAKEKQLVEMRLPPELQGKAISDGPLPFIFGAKADTLKKRYWLRLTTPPTNAKTEIWLEAYPKFQQDAANFSKVDLILNKETFMPVAMQIHTPGKKETRTVYRFGEPSINGLFSKINGEFASPMTPLGWKRIVEHAPSAGDPPAKNAQKPQPAANNATAGRQGVKTK